MVSTLGRVRHRLLFGWTQWSPWADTAVAWPPLASHVTARGPRVALAVLLGRFEVETQFRPSEVSWVWERPR